MLILHGTKIVQLINPTIQVKKSDKTLIGNVINIKYMVHPDHHTYKYIIFKNSNIYF